ncbi:MAG: hypothetical protein AVO35_13075 [Candidatus Aegiribacteria sp. MLS_C]|nr:MAG: hypothetical protein AVO35_13075 [Candidatus Aegiribacteria sp. MLS_C]
MSDQSYSLVLMAGLVAGPASAFLVDSRLMPVYLLFPLAAVLTPARKGTLRILPMAVAPLIALLWAHLSGNSHAVERCIRWVAALASGASMAGALGASRASRLLLSASKRMDMSGLLESLAMALSMAGPFSGRIRDTFVRSRREGEGFTDALATALASVESVELEIRREMLARNGISLASAIAAWMLLLGGIAGVV